MSDCSKSTERGNLTQCANGKESRCPAPESNQLDRVAQQRDGEENAEGYAGSKGWDIAVRRCEVGEEGSTAGVNLLELIVRVVRIVRHFGFGALGTRNMVLEVCLFCRDCHLWSPELEERRRDAEHLYYSVLEVFPYIPRTPSWQCLPCGQHPLTRTRAA